MASKTLKLIRDYHNLLNEADGDMEQPTPEAPQPETAPAPPEELPITSELENDYISNLIDAALFEPSSQEANTLLNLQSVMQMKRFTNARDEVLPVVLAIISKSTDNGDLRKQLNTID
jgi:hypothetical protein